MDLETNWPLLEDLAATSGGRVFTPEDAGELANLLYQNGTLFLYFDLQQQSKTIGVTDVFMATHTGLLSS